MEDNKELLIGYSHTFGDKYDISTISTDPLANTPIIDRVIDTAPGLFPFVRGDVGTYAPKTQKWELLERYKKHDFEIATVLGEDKENQKLLVYGVKIGERVISTRNNIRHNYTFYQRGDFLLLRLKPDTDEIIHNITQQILKQKLNEWVKGY